MVNTQGWVSGLGLDLLGELLRLVHPTHGERWGYGELGCWRAQDQLKVYVSASVTVALSLYRISLFGTVS